MRLGEKWTRGSDGWYYITPDGSLYRYSGRQLIVTLNSSVHANPAQLHDPLTGTDVVVLSISGTTLTIDPVAGFSGVLFVTASVSDGVRSDSEEFQLTVEPNQAPTLAAIADQSMLTSQNTIDVALTASDPENDPLTFTATVEDQLFLLDQEFNFSSSGNYYTNLLGLGEKWIRGTGGWFIITPDGNVSRFVGREVVAQVRTNVHADPALLHNAARGITFASTSISGTTLTVDPVAGFVGDSQVTVTVATAAVGPSDPFSSWSTRHQPVHSFKSM